MPPTGSGVPRSTLYHRLKSWGLQPAAFKSDREEAGSRSSREPGAHRSPAACSSSTTHRPISRCSAGALQQSGFEVETAEGGTEALAAADRNPPDLVLLDVDMPQPDGYETCRRLKAQERFANTPIIFLSGLSAVADKMAAFAAGGVDFVTKPFDIEEVRVRVSTHLELETSPPGGRATRPRARLRASRSCASSSTSATISCTWWRTTCGRHSWR